MSDKKIHFGWFVAWGRHEKHMSRKDFAEKVGITERSLIRIENDETPKSNPDTMIRLALAMGIDPQLFDDAWRQKPVSKPPTRERTRPVVANPPSAPASPAAENNLANLSREEITRRIDELRQVAHDKGIRWPMGIEDKPQRKAAKQRKGKRGDERSQSTQKPENSGPIQPPTLKGKHMPQAPPWHWDRDKERYHNNTRCGPGSEIPQQHRIAGTGGKKLCDHCAKLNAEGK